jgi:predicted nucleotide-binding protein
VARRGTPLPEPQPPTVSPEKGIALIRGQIEIAERLLASCPLSSDDDSSRELLTRNFLEKAFGIHSPNVSSVMDVGKYGAFPMYADEGWWANRRADNLQTQIKKLVGLVDLLQTEAQLASGSLVDRAGIPTGHRLFLVHGHDEKALHETARFLERLKQDIIILREQPNKGRTIIEKFEDYADVGFAVVLLTSDDRGGAISETNEAQKPRARQNVILELGYFLGRLGRNRVCALYEPGVEIPSDYSGVLYIPLDEQGAWRLSLAKEMKAAGLAVDMNLAL